MGNPLLVWLTYILSNHISKSWRNCFDCSAHRCLDSVDVFPAERLKPLPSGSCRTKCLQNIFPWWGNYRQKEICHNEPLALTERLWLSTPGAMRYKWWNQRLKKSARLWSWVTIWQKLFVRFPNFRSNSDKCNALVWKKTQLPSNVLVRNLTGWFLYPAVVGWGKRFAQFQLWPHKAVAHVPSET